jgi:hypothetical protein
MTRDDTIRMAREAGFNKNELAYLGDNFQRLVDLARADEREACLNCYSPDDTAQDWADKIRARGTNHG